MREIFAGKGFSGKLLDDIVAHVTSDKELWIDTMMKEELGIIEDRKSPLGAGGVTFGAFILFGSIPLSVYLFSYLSGQVTADPDIYLLCIVATALALFGVGALRGKIAMRSSFRSGLETLVAGGGAALIAYIVGVSLRNLAS